MSRVLSFLSSLTVFALFQSDHPEPELFHDEQSSQVSDRICPQMPKAPPLFWPAPRVAVHQKITFYILSRCDTVKIIMIKKNKKTKTM